MSSRRKFLKLTALGSILPSVGWASKEFNVDEIKRSKSAKVISTWNHGLEANKAAYEILKDGGNSLDAVEKGVKVTESDPENRSVGIGGLPDRDGNVTLDACIMDFEHNCGGVAYLQNIENPISVARKVMEDTPHVLLVGDGAKRFAIEKGFKEKDLLTEKSKMAWQEWLKTSKYKPIVNIENHDTIGMLAQDVDGNISGACTTSGMAYKLNGRVGDSPIIGAGLFVDNEIGGACATGVGEMMIRVAGSHLVVEFMRQGHHPNVACMMAVDRIIQKHKSVDGMQVGFLAIRKDGEVGAFSLYNGFNYAFTDKSTHKLVDAEFDRKW